MDSFSKKNKISIAIIIAAFVIGGFLYFFNISEVEARSGCCSWHGGVCTYKCPDGVNVGYMCCDGTSLSTKCAPYYSKCPTKPTPECPSHSTYNSSSDSCECNYGYIASGGECIDADAYCHDKYGSHSSYDISSESCECDYGYKLINDKCAKPEPVKEQLPLKEQSAEESTIEEEQSPAPQEDLPAPEKFTAEIPKEDGGRRFIWWIIGIGAAAYTLYALGKRKRGK